MKLKTALALLLTGSVSLFGADSTIINLTTLTGLADADSFVVVDASDTTQSAQGTTKDITTLNVFSFLYSDTALADDSEMTIDIDTVGTAGATGLKVTIIGTR